MGLNQRFVTGTGYGLQLGSLGKHSGGGSPPSIWGGRDEAEMAEEANKRQQAASARKVRIEVILLFDFA